MRTFVYWHNVFLHRLCLTSIYTNSQGGTNSVERRWIPVGQKDEFFLPILCVTWWTEQKKKPTKQPITTSSLACLLDHLHKGNYLLPLTLRMLQPATVRVVEVTTLKLLLTIVGHWHWDKRVHAVEAPLKSKTKTQRQYTDCGLLRCI